MSVLCHSQKGGTIHKFDTRTTGILYGILAEIARCHEYHSRSMIDRIRTYELLDFRSAYFVTAIPAFAFNDTDQAIDVSKFYIASPIARGWSYGGFQT
ncbi:DNA gyrase topoisomerase II A subunit [Eggerthella sp. YY7918]|nr:DNA gyrase topoisomerase II A subunit [Eggerthella sp. YY7918]